MDSYITMRISITTFTVIVMVLCGCSTRNTNVDSAKNVEVAQVLLASINDDGHGSVYLFNIEDAKVNFFYENTPFALTRFVVAKSSVVAGNSITIKEFYVWNNSNKNGCIFNIDRCQIERPYHPLVAIVVEDTASYIKLAITPSVHDEFPSMNGVMTFKKVGNLSAWH